MKVISKKEEKKKEKRVRSEKKDSYSSGGSGPFDWGHASAGEAFWPEASAVRQERSIS